MTEHDEEFEIEEPESGGELTETGPETPEGTTISPGAPEEPSIGRAYQNFRVMLSRGLGPVGGAWLLLYVVYVAGMLAFAYFSGRQGFAPGPPGTEGPGVVANAISVVFVIAIFILGTALLRPLREIGFRGEGAIPSIGAAFAKSFERIPQVLAFFLIFGSVTSAVGYAVTTLLPPIVKVLVGVPILLLIYVLASPMIYVVPVSDLPLIEAITESLRLIRDHPLYLVLAYLVLIATGFGLSCVFFGMAIVPVIGWICGAFTSIFVAYAYWIAYGAIFGTIEEARGGFGG